MRALLKISFLLFSLCLTFFYLSAPQNMQLNDTTSNEHTCLVSLEHSLQDLIINPACDVKSRDIIASVMRNDKTFTKTHTFITVEQQTAAITSFYLISYYPGQTGSIPALDEDSPSHYTLRIFTPPA